MDVAPKVIFLWWQVIQQFVPGCEVLQMRDIESISYSEGCGND
jgi:hypothetical protein